MSDEGMGVLIQKYFGESYDVSQLLNRRIVHASLVDENIILKFDDKSVALYDAGQSCCESRYITCDDDFNNIIGGELLDIQVKKSEQVDGEWGDVHEIDFVEITTSKGFITFCTHNEHNGYYGGFALTVKEIHQE